jgi:formylglycine-generating enzyme required for sulfatase activity
LNETLAKWKDTPLPLANLLRQNKGRVTLPSEAEWEKAARGPHPSPAASGGGAGSGGRIYPWGDAFDPNNANTFETRIGFTSAAGCFPTNADPYGLHDMSGNVMEWCATKWQENYQNYADDNNVSEDSSRMLRGGAFTLDQDNSRCAYRTYHHPGACRDYIGFRAVVSSGSRS